MKEILKYHSDCSIIYHFKSLPKVAFLLIFIIFFSTFSTYNLIKSQNLSFSTFSLRDHTYIRTNNIQPTPALAPEPDPVPIAVQNKPKPTNLSHVVFGIGGSAEHWPHRKEYVKYWWQANETRGFVFLDKPVNITRPDSPWDYPTLKVSSPTDQLPYSRKNGSRSALRITRILSEIIKMEELNDVRWFVLGDDDTIFFTDNLVRVLRKYDHAKMYYIGSISESHRQDVEFAYDMAFGGGGIAISYPLAKAIANMQDHCIRRYPSLYGSDDRIHACVTELGVPLTKEPGFHQCDIYGSLFGILAAHPIAPFVTIHHLDLVHPIFPNKTQIESLQQLKILDKLDSAALMQQSICYDTRRNWTISVSLGFAVQIIRGLIPPREMQRVERTFLNWYLEDDIFGLSMNSRPFSQHPCQKPYVYYLYDAKFVQSTNTVISEYIHHKIPHSQCWWKMDNPEKFPNVVVYKKPNPLKWDQAPRRDCCRVVNTQKHNSVVIDVGECGENQVIEPF